ncbi:UNVERIFIED_CONTAM: 2-oxoglutarate-dependent dioxygenase DAO [Sesamum radiatum]|uniref:2-oxoglutarate-dependent dioxygenase DAO n=1 Tax=Sesamum radiatum TaxID=300843 RepID=A0AAW2VNP4_SESRA
MYEMKEVVASLLELPLEIKQRNVDAIAGSGYRVPGLINPIHEGLGLYDIASSQAVDAFCAQLDATPLQRDTITRYTKAVHELIMDMGRKIGEGLGLRDVPFENWPCQFRMNYYPFMPETIGSDGLRMHTDNGFLTIVQDDELFGGLEVMRKSGPKEAMVEALPELVAPENPRLFVSFRFEDFRKNRFYKHMNAGEALDLFRVES